ncbi:MAG: hypothetical protein S4CHLAM102_03600 [Chlamydiia bacterium]|nr:hypothetical protein [Chlamydiia bacterium]
MALVQRIYDIAHQVGDMAMTMAGHSRRLNQESTEAYLNRTRAVADEIDMKAWWSSAGIGGGTLRVVSAFVPDKSIQGALDAAGTAFGPLGSMGSGFCDSSVTTQQAYQQIGQQYLSDANRLSSEEKEAARKAFDTVLKVMTLCCQTYGVR